jgi:hypothetical protein
MRTTLTLDDDVAVEIERLRKARDASLKDVVNEALRLGVREMAAPAKKRKPFRTRGVDLGELLIPSIDDVTEALAIAEGEDFK